MNIHLDPEDYRPVIDAAIAAALTQRQAERPHDRAGRVLVTKREAAGALGVSEATVDRLRKTAGLPAVRLDGRVMFRPAALEAWASAQEVAE